MIICDGCLRSTPTNDVSVSIGDEKLRYQLCKDCRNAVTDGIRSLVFNCRPRDVRELCPSLTREQVEQVHLFYRQGT